MELLDGNRCTVFLSTPSARRATRRQCRARYDGQFLSTPSARRATSRASCTLSGSAFLSTPSARRATHRRRQLHPDQRISIHALREEGDAAPAPWTA